MKFLGQCGNKFAELYRKCAAEKNLNIPNSLTVLRIIFVPAICLLIKHNYMLSASIVFLMASITDWADGYLARKFNLQTLLGELLDPIADKLLIIPILYLLPYGLWSISVYLIFLREMAVVMGRFVVTNTSFEASAKVKMHGKIKATAQYISVIYAINLLPYFNWAVFLTACMTVISGLVYLVNLWPVSAKPYKTASA